MPRPNLGPKLVAIRKAGWSRPMLYIRWTERGRPRVRATGYAADAPDQAAAAQQYFGRWLAERARAARKGPGDPAQVWVRDVIEDYVRERADTVAAADTMMLCARPLMHFFADDTVATMTPGRVREYWDWRRRHSIRVVNPDIGTIEIIERPIAASTVIRDLAGVLRPAIRHAVQQRRLMPGEYYVPTPSAPPGREYWITRSEAARLLWETRRDKRARLHLPLYTLIALYTGQRRGAILDLTWRQVDLITGRIDFNPPGRIQTKKRRPRIPIPRSLLAALRRAHRRASSEYVIAYRGEKVADIKTGFNSAAKRAGIPDCTSHTLRHTAATWMAQRGVPMGKIGEYIGHSEARTTELYAHAHPDFMSEAKRALERR
jgi:integrase